ncbi:hypothetical protein ABVT39_024695 [Epinephelus coioides]
MVAGVQCGEKYCCVCSSHSDVLQQVVDPAELHAGVETVKNFTSHDPLLSCGPVENGQLPDPANWGVADVVNYFKATGFEEQATAFQDQEIDGKSLLLMTRNDVLTGLSIKLGPALKIYEYHVKPLQTQHLKSNAS